MAVFRWITILLYIAGEGGGEFLKVTAKMYLADMNYILVRY